MERELVAQRERAMEAADRAVDAAWPERKGDAYVGAMRAVAAELQAVAALMQTEGSDAIEQSRTQRYLGCVYADLSPTFGKIMLHLSRDSLLKAEKYLGGRSAPLEQAKIDFNLGNTLWQIDANDSALLREAERRLLAARAVFASWTPQHLKSVDAVLVSTRALLKLAPLAGTVERQRAELEQIGADMAKEKDPRKLAAKLKDAGTGIHSAMEQLGPLLDGLPDAMKLDPRFANVGLELARLKTAARGGAAPVDAQAQAIPALLKARLADEVRKGAVGVDRAKGLQALIDAFGSAAAAGGGDLKDDMEQLGKIRQVMEAQLEMLHYLSHDIPRPPEGSRAAELVEAFWIQRRFIATETTRGGKSEGDSKAAFDLSIRSSVVDRRFYEAGNDAKRALIAEKEALRPFALEARNFAARHHAMLASPKWAKARLPADTDAVFLSGLGAAREAAEQACRRRGMTPMSAPTGGSFAAARWEQMQKAFVAIFDLGAASAVERAAAAYELGIALALGKPAVILSRKGATLPFDVDIPPVMLAGDTGDVGEIGAALDRAAMWMLPRPEENPSRSTIEWALAQFSGGGNIYVEQTLKQLEPLLAEPDPAAADAVLATLVSFLGAGAPTLLHPAWPPRYPEAGALRLFHVMPFAPDWANAAKKQTKQTCKDADVEYKRGDEVDDPNVVVSIWSEICRATHVLVDLTGFNPNVALELGIAHTLGRKTLLVGQGDTVGQLFPMIAHDRFQPYSRPGDRKFTKALEQFLDSTD